MRPKEVEFEEGVESTARVRLRRAPIAATRTGKEPSLRRKVRRATMPFARRRRRTPEPPRETMAIEKTVRNEEERGEGERRKEKGERRKEKEGRRRNLRF
jgi:hypothetical protein